MPRSPDANTVDRPILDGAEEILIGNLDVLNQEVAAAKSEGAGEPAASPKPGRR